MSLLNQQQRVMLHESALAILSIAIIVFTFALFYALLFKSVSQGNKDVILFVLGVLSSQLSQVISYWFGSSKGNDETVRSITNRRREQDRQDDEVQ